MIRSVLFLLLLLISHPGYNQRYTEKTDQSPAAKLKRDIEYLSSDELDGRLAGSKGEALAAAFIESRFKTLDIPPFKSRKYTWDFTIKDGLKVGTNSFFKINNQAVNIGSDVIPLPFGTGNYLKGMALPYVDETDNVWLVSMASLQQGTGNIMLKTLYEKAKSSIHQGASAVVFFNDIDVSKDLIIKNPPKLDPLNAPVVVINHKTYLALIKPNMKKDWIHVEAKLGYEDAILYAKNVVAMIDNQAPFTIVISANYDHLGNQGDVMNGANNNASGVASLLALAEMIKANKLTQHNYMFLALSGSKFGNAGALSFLQDQQKILSSYNCLIDLNMLGRFNKMLKHLYVAGVGTSSLWGILLEKNQKNEFLLKVDSAGFGYGHYSLFYKKDIPVLSFSTGYAADFSKPTDDINKINTVSQAAINAYIFRIIQELNQMNKLPFKTTNNPAEKLENMKNDLGFVPDYSFNDDGVRIATCLINRLADKAGLEPEDIIIQIAEFPIQDLDDYVMSMNKLDKGREIAITVKRGKNEFKFFVVL